MAVLTVNLKDEKLQEVDAKNRSRDEIVDEAIDLYLRQKAMDCLRTEGCTPKAMEMARKFLTEEDFSAFVEEEIHQMRDEEG
ncbi:MAG: hypothetical protein FWB85_06320 [Chitinispirillia bacterium]|nr:hypothetical protein [Chitinispirillia bacterium]